MPDQAATEKLIEEMVEIFKAVLPPEDVDAESDLFELGGHSVTAGKVVSRAREQLGISVSMRDVFTARTPRGIIEAVNGRASLSRK